MKIYVASDHAGRPIKTKVKQALKHLGYNVTDLSPTNKETDDYPDYAHKVAKHVRDEANAKGFLSCGTGIGMSIAANKTKGVRAAKVTSKEEAILARKHNDANILVLGNNNDFEGKQLLSILKCFFEAGFEKGRHERRVNKIEKNKKK